MEEEDRWIELEYEQGDNNDYEDGGEDEELDDDDDYEEEEEEAEVEMILPKVSSWTDSDGTTMQGVVVISDGSPDINKYPCGFDDCSICLKAWTSHGKHRIWYQF